MKRIKKIGFCAILAAGLSNTTLETKRLRIREDLIADFKRIVGNPTADDLEGFERLPNRTMKAVNDFLCAGFKLENIKTFTIWKDHQNK